MRKMRTTQGFTLIEVLISLVILAVGMLGLSSMSMGIVNVNAANKRHTIASALVQDRLENIKRTGYAGATTPSFTEGYNTIPNYGAYKRVTTIALNTPATNMRMVTVTVSWDGDRQALSATTILAQ